MFKKPCQANKTMEALDEEIQRSLIGTPYNICSEIWNLINPLQTLVDYFKNERLLNPHPKYLLWALYFIFCYNTEAVATRIVGGVHEQTYRKWTWSFIFAIAGLKDKVVSFFLSILLFAFCFFISNTTNTSTFV